MSLINGKSENGKLTAKGSTPSAPLSLVQFHLLDAAAAMIEQEIFNLHIIYTLEKELVLVPMEGFVICIPDNLVVAIQQTINTLGIEDRSIEGFKHIVLYTDGSLLAPVEEFLLSVKVGYLGIDGDNGIGELELTGQCIDEAVVTYSDIAACTCFKPSVAISAKQNGAT
jgi:hypothetical protein